MPGPPGAPSSLPSAPMMATPLTATTHIYNDLKLFSTYDKFYIEPSINPKEALVIERNTSKSYVIDRSAFTLPVSELNYRPICGILGTIRLISGDYLIVATYRICIGKINGKDIYQLAGTVMIPFANSLTHLSQQQDEDEKIYLKMLKSVLETPRIYFSYDYDLTHTIQRLYNTPPDFLQSSMVERADTRFLWNINLLQQFKDRQFKRFMLPIMMGFISINHCAINGKMFSWTLVSRRSVFRAGPRLFCRGIDLDGSVANYVETEQIIECDGTRASFVQTRGSIPLYWSQLPNLRYKPRPRLQENEDHVGACQRHLAEQLQLYGRQVLINLIDQRGAEEAMEVGYRNAINQINDPSVRYESFDFHAECRQMKWHRLDILIDRLAHEQEEFSYFLVGRNGVVGAQQTGTFRTNCIDCLDRTNVVQSLLARRSLTAVLQRLGVLRPGDQISQHENLETLFKNVWADNADVISIQYSGTGALKNDFTRTGKRTKLGILRDGMNSLTRYCKNNFADGFRQDALDLFLGQYSVREGEGLTVPCPLNKDKDWKYITFPSVLLIAVSMFFASAILPSEYSTEILLYLMFWGAMVGSTVAIIFRYGKEFVDYPKLKEINVNQLKLLSTNGIPL